MAINFLNTVDLNFNQLRKAAIESLAANPAAGVLGQLYYDTAVSALKICTTAQVIGGANAVWTEVGATSGVETLSTTQLNNSAGNSLTVLTDAIGNVTINSFAYAGGGNVGYVPKDGLVNQYLDGTGAWVDVTTGDIESVNASTVNNRLGIAITTPLGPDPTVGLNIVGLTNLGSTPAVSDELVIYDASSEFNRAVTIANLKLATDTLYDLTTAPTGTAIRLTDAAGSDDVTISGSANQIAVSRVSASELNVAFTPSITVVDNINLGGVIAQAGGTSTTGVNAAALTGSTTLVLTANNAAVLVGMQVTGAGIGENITITTVTDAKTFQLDGAITIANGITLTFEEQNSFSSPLDMNNNRINEVKTGVLGTDGVNLAQVNSLVAGIGVFKGGFNATTGLTVPGGQELEGASNIALDKGDYFVVTTAGSDFFTLALEPGDFIFAEVAIGAGSSPVVGDYIVVQADANVAGAGATDGATEKGVAGFDSANFTVSSNGWVQLKPQSNPYGISVLLTGGSDSNGETTFNVDVTTAARFGTGALAKNCKAEVITEVGRLTSYPEVTGNGAGSMVFKFRPVVADGVLDTSGYRALISIV